MCRLLYLLFISLLWLSSVVDGSENVTFTDEMPVDSLINLTGNNDLWTILLKDCEKPTLSCVQNNIFNYLKKTLDETDDLQFTSFMKFSKNKQHYVPVERSFANNSNDTEYEEAKFPIEAMARNLQDDTSKFLMTHDLEIALPEGLLPNSVLKVAPKGFGNSGAMVNLEIVSTDLEEARAMEAEGRTFKKIRKFINERIIYAILALLLVLKLLAFKFLFLLPLIVGAATAKKLLLKILLFVFPFLHHIFKFCAYYPIQAKYHHHKHLISHIHQVAPHHDHHESYGPPTEHHGPHDTHITEFDDDVSVLPDDGTGFPHGLISHRRDPTYGDNEIHSSHRKPHRPLTSIEIERMIAKAEKEAIIKARLEKERLRIRDENLKLQEQLNQAIKLQEKLKQQATFISKHVPPPRLPHGKPGGSFNPPPLKGSSFDSGAANVNSDGLELPAGYIPQHTVPQRPQNPPAPPQTVFDQPYQTVQQNHFEQQYQNSLQHNYDQKFQASQQQVSQVFQSPGPVYKPEASTSYKPLSGTSVDVQKSVEYDPRIGSFENSKEIDDFKTQKVVENFAKNKIANSTKFVGANVKPKEIDPFYSPILAKIDKILQELGFIDEPCKERLICSMYKNPTAYSPHSNLLSVELSRDASELQLPTKTNVAVIRFYKYVQSARDGQDQRDCLRLYPACDINTDLS